MSKYLKEHFQQKKAQGDCLYFEKIKKVVSALKKMITALEHLTFQCHNFGLSMYKLNLKKIESNMKYFNKFLLLS